MCFGKADYEREAWRTRAVETREEEREPQVSWREPEKEFDEEEAREREEVFERV